MILKGTGTSVSQQASVLYQDRKLPGHLGLKNQVRLHLYRNQSIRTVACSNIPRYFNAIMGLSLKMK